MTFQRFTHSTCYRFVLIVATGLALSSPRRVHAQTLLPATITYPANLSTNADITLPIRWSSVANAQGYYLYVGSTFGASDLVNTGTIQQTSYPAVGLPSGQTLYVRLWTKISDHWQYRDSTFTAAPVVRTRITYPADGALNADLTKPIQWLSVPNAQKYYLYVGTTPGAKDLVNTGETLQTSYLPANLPHTQTLYARMWTKSGGVWRYIDSTFSGAPRALITYPVSGAVNADLSKPIQWTALANVQAYYLYVGSTLGAKDLVNTGETLQTSYLGVTLPAGPTLYARIWTKSGGVWRYADSTFNAAPPPIATLIYPANGALNIDQTQPAKWTSLAWAQAYYLKIGSAPGGKDYFDSYETQLTTVPIIGVPAGRILYARLCTKIAGTWRCNDSTFTASPVAPVFLYPTDSSVAVDPGRPFQWTAPANAVSHELRVGTSAGANDVFESGEITATSVLVPGLPPSGTVYGRVLSKVNGIWRHTDAAFTLEGFSAIATTSVPRNGEAAFDTRQPFTWNAVPLARGYRLTIGTAPGAADLHDSGEIHVTRRFVPSLPAGPLFGRLQTKINGIWYSSDFTFIAVANTASADLQIKSAFWATDFVRGMALSDNRPFTWTELARELPPQRYRALCNDYAQTLLRVMTDMNSQLPSRRLDIALNPNNYDAHTLVEMFNPPTQSWLLLDPTFDLTVKRTSDQAWATAEEVSSATTSQQWGNVSYEFLGPSGDFFARNYYLDYPLLFVNVYHAGQVPVNGQGGAVLPYMIEVPMPASGSYGTYAVGCADDADETTAWINVSGVDQGIDCNGVDSLSYVFGASSIAATKLTHPSIKVYRPRRYVF